MKKLFSLLMLGAAVVFASCQKDDLSGESKGGSVDVSLTAKLPASGPLTKSGNGDASAVNRYILEVYTGGELYQRWVQATPTFDIRLVSSLTYDFVFWADHVENASSEEGLNTDNHYLTATADGLRAVALKVEAYKGNDNTRDAFTGVLSQQTVTANFEAPNIQLRRPFGKLNVKTTDLEHTGVTDKYKPTHVKLSFTKVYTRFNALTGDLSNELSLSYTEPAAVVDANGNLSADYIFAPESESELANFSMVFYNGGAQITTNDNFKNIPVRRNYQTNVSGNLLTKQGALTVTVKEDFDGGALEKEIAEVGNVAQIAAALATATHVKVTTAPDAAAEIALPEAVAGKAVTIEIPATEQKITLKQEGNTTDKAPASLTVDIPTSSEVQIDLPGTTVTLQGQTYGKVTAKTADNTLIIAAGVTVADLTVEKGSVVVYGDVAKFTSVADGSKIYWGAGTEDRLREVLAKDAATNHGVILTADIRCEKLPINGNQDNQDGFHIGSSSRTGYDSSYKYNGYQFDGNGFTLSGAAWNNILAVYANDAVVKNLKITQSAADKSRKGNAGISVYRSNNVTLNQVTVYDCGKAGIIVNASTVTASGLKISGNAWKVGVDVAIGTNPSGGNEPRLTLTGTNEISDPVQIKSVKNNSVSGDGWRIVTSGYAEDAAYYVWSNSRVSDLVNPQWTPDRTAPLKWAAVPGESVSLTTKTEPNNNWYSWHGLTAAVEKPLADTWSLETTLTPSDRNGVRQTVWLSIFDQEDTDMKNVIDWCVVGYKVDGEGTKNWQSYIADDSGTNWMDISGIREADVYKVEIRCSGSTIEQYVNGVKIRTYSLNTDKTQTKIGRIYYNSYSYGESYDTRWSYPVVR